MALVWYSYAIILAAFNSNGFSETIGFAIQWVYLCMCWHFRKENVLIAVYFYTVLCFTCEYTCSSTTRIIYAVAGIENTNLNIRCFDLSVDPGYDGYFWKINGSVYGALHLPREYEVCCSRCNLAILTIPVVLAEMDGYTFQCFGIHYQTNTVHEGTVTELNVTETS